MSACADRRLGFFRINLDVINTDPECAAAALEKVVVVRAEVRYDWDAVEYLGIHPDFAEVKPGNQIPFYTAQMETTEAGVRRLGWA